MKSNKIKLFLLIIFPFIFLAPYTLQLLDVGNDFEIYYFTYKKYIFELLKNGHIPLWSPSEAAGYTLIFNPLTQFFYLPSWVHYLISFLFNDLSKYSFLIYTISAISIFNIGLFKFLKTFNISAEIIFTVVLITSVSLKLTELLRFPNALHAFAWFPWVLYGINSTQFKYSSIKSFSIIFISSLMIFTAGYPYYILYGFILFCLYILFLLIIEDKNYIYGTKNLKFVSNLKFFIQVSLPAILAAVIFSPIYFKTSEIIKEYSPTHIVNYGTAGGINEELKGLVEVTRFFQRDMDATSLGFKIGQTPFDDIEEIDLGSNGYSCGTGDSFVTQMPRLKTDLVDMEAYAIAKICYMKHVKFRCFKYISDNADADANDDWIKNVSAGKELFIKRMKNLLAE